MSLPLTRRIARAALLTAAGAASVVGAAGAASAVSAPQVPPVGGLSNLDTANVGGTLDGATTKTGALASRTGDKVQGHGSGHQGGLPTDKLTTGGLPTNNLGNGGLGLR